MVSETIPVYVYTAVNGYAWQGCDRLTADFLQKALKATGVLNRNDVWGGIIRRPIASPAWPEWPKSRMCTILYRFLRSSARDQMGRESSYIAAACLPFREQEDGIVNFRRILNSSVMRYAQKEGFDKLGLELDESWLIPDVEEEGLLQDSDWRESWAEPRLFSGRTCLEQLSRLFHNPGSSLGDLKAVVRLPDEGSTGHAASATYSVFPQIAAVLVAESAYGDVSPADLDGAREALSNWKVRLAEAKKLGGVLGSIGINDFVQERTRQATLSENTLNDRIAKEKEFRGEVESLERRLGSFRMSVSEMDAEAADGRVKTDLLNRLDQLERKLNECDDSVIRERELPKAERCRARADDLFRRVNLIRGYWNGIRNFARRVEQKEHVSEDSIDMYRPQLDKAKQCSGSEDFAKDVLEHMDNLFRQAVSTLRDAEEAERRKKAERASGLLSTGKRERSIPQKQLTTQAIGTRVGSPMPMNSFTPRAVMPPRATPKDPSLWLIISLVVVIIVVIIFLVLLFLGVFSRKSQTRTNLLFPPQPVIETKASATETNKVPWYRPLLFWRRDSNNPADDDAKEDATGDAGVDPRETDDTVSGDGQTDSAAAGKNSVQPTDETSGEDTAASSDAETASAQSSEAASGESNQDSSDAGVSAEQSAVEHLVGEGPEPVSETAEETPKGAGRKESAKKPQPVQEKMGKMKAEKTAEKEFR